MKPIIEFKDFSFQYNAQKNPTLKNINLKIYEGEKILICGPSGSGKSTLGNCLNGLIPFSYQGKIEGSLIVDGIETKNSSIFELSNHIGTVLQDPDGQFVGLTVAEDIAFSLENDCNEQSLMHQKVHDVSKLVDIEERLSNAPQELSGGQKQRVSLAGVIINNIKILLFDEPLANLDPKTGKTAIELIDDIKNKTNTTVVIIEHRLEDALWRNVDRIILVDEGTILADLKPNELLSSDLLKKHGIREPLYLTALKYAGVKVTPDIKPEHINSLVLSNDDISTINKWYKNTPIKPVINNNEDILRIEDLHFSYFKGTEILHGISLSIKKGEMLSIVGQNGAGKSTLAKLICGFEKTSEGHIYYGGEDITNEPIRKRAEHIGYVMQNPNQMISQTMIFDEVAMGIKNTGLTEDEIKEKVYAVLKICGLYEFRNWPISALSFGQKKRVTIASVLVMGPKIIILDEPTAGQDFKHYTEIMEFLRELNNQGITIIMITHDMHLMLEYTPRAIVVVKGKVVKDDSASAVLCNKELVESSSLKETSLFELATICHIDDPVKFTDCFVSTDKEVRSHE
ncbi:MAG: ABC transporter ATP-binding protein [Erysipelotrichaceae bacterium]|nr:ABC transporter ATP-binding protein [Erysipelotrichaceae bacterium]